MGLLRIIQVASYVVGILAGVLAPVFRVVPTSQVLPHGMLYVAMACFLCSIATKFVAEAIEKPKEEPKAKAVAA